MPLTQVVCLLAAALGVVTSHGLRYHNCSCGVPMYPVGAAGGRIVNGRPARREEFPWLVGLQTGKYYTAAPKCGGSLITDRHVITAGHCLLHASGLHPDTTYVLVGAYDWTDRFDVRKSQIVKVQQGFPLSTFNYLQLEGDISVVELEQPIELNPTAYPICLPPANLTLDQVKKAVVSGWGRLVDGGRQPHKNYRTERHLKILDHKQCMEVPIMRKMMGSGALTERQICALGDNTDSCQGDSGGPLMWFNEASQRYHLIGVVSFGWVCNTPGLPGIYTNLLNDNIRNYITCNLHHGVTCQT
ncbi:chymotrypsin-like protease CTRL-1 [Pollicipes pollicipes]|uniref:chymotrypsin-like protease CTRL-1 n=1 Tax=Pollicipes pollicipes TaxID=41117 RepID=UPI001884B508|nr:chymotrypsin-like protease CTRL-1 [Pollicipes pollicipes]